MPKIPNYTAVHDEHPMNGYRWEHDSDSHIRVEVSKNVRGMDEWDDSYWRVEVWNYGHMMELGPLSANKDELREVAVEWMRDNPDGWEPNKP